jgi:putative ABC transport system permease protein
MTVRRSSQARPDFGQPLTGIVIGVIRDVHQVRQDVQPTPEVYVPYTLETWPWGSIVARTRDGARAVPALREAIGGVDPRLVEKGSAGIKRFSVIENAIERSLESRKLSLRLITGFAVCALILAAIGMYGVVAYGIAQRSRELGVRKALGATDRAIAELVLRESLMLASIGVAIGCIGAWGSARLIEQQLFQTGSVDPAAYGATIVLLVAIALVATWVPARRATRLDPTIAMRGE